VSQYAGPAGRDHDFVLISICGTSLSDGGFLTYFRVCRGIGLLAFAGFLIVCLSLASVIALRNYQTARALILTEPPSSLLQNPGKAHLENLQSIQFVSRGSRLAGWYIPARNGAVVVVTHGTNGDRTGMLTEIRLLAADGFGVLAFDWPGLGQSEGRIYWGDEARDALTSAIDWLVLRPDVDRSRIGGLGFSMGGFVLAQVAAKDRRLRAVVLESAPTDFDAYQDFHFSKWGLLSRWPARWALRDSGLFSDSALQRVGSISPRPLLIIGQTDDPEIPAAMTRELDDAAGPPKQLWLISGARHGGYMGAAGIEYEHRLQTFFRKNLLDVEVRQTTDGGR
jgi:uncharacterized protein